MYVYSELLKAQLENLSGDPTGAKGMIYYNTTSDIVKWYDGSSWLTAMDLSTAQTATNKTFTSPTINGAALSGTLSGAPTFSGNFTYSGDPVASGNGAFEVPQGSVAQRPSAAAGQMRFNTDSNVFEGYNGSSWGTFATATTATPSAEGLVTSYVPTIQSSVTSTSSSTYAPGDTDGYNCLKVDTSSNDVAVTLPTASANPGREYTVVVTDATNVTSITGESSELGEDIYLYAVNESATFYCDGTNWRLKAANWYNSVGNAPTAQAYVNNSGTPTFERVSYSRVDNNTVMVTGKCAFIPASVDTTSSCDWDPPILGDGGFADQDDAHGTCDTPSIDDLKYGVLECNSSTNRLRIRFETDTSSGGSLSLPFVGTYTLVHA